MNNHHASYFKIDDYLSDITRLGGIRWDALKAEAMDETTYQTKSWYGALNPAEKDRLEVMRAAQLQQGDMNALKTVAY